MASKSDQPPADDRVYDVGSFEAELFWEKNRSVILICMGSRSRRWPRRSPCGFSARTMPRQAAESLLRRGQRSRRVARSDCEIPGFVHRRGMPIFCLADSMREQGNLEESSALYQKFLAVFPESPLIWRCTAWTCRKPRGRREDGRSDRCFARSAGKGVRQLRRTVCRSSGRSHPYAQR